MLEENNLWQKTWDSAKAVPVSEQKSLFDFRRDAEIVLHYMETLDIGNYMNQYVFLLYKLIFCKELWFVPSHHVIMICQDGGLNI